MKEWIRKKKRMVSGGGIALKMMGISENYLMNAVAHGMIGERRCLSLFCSRGERVGVKVQEIDAI